MIYTELPKVPDWVMKNVSNDPGDAVTTTVRTFATVKPRFKIMPMLNDAANRDRANQIEAALAYNFHQAGRRNDASVEWDVMMSATLYAEVAAQVIYLPYQEKILKAMGKDARRVKAAKRYGDFAFIIHNPANVYPEWSEYGLEGVMTTRVQYWDEFVDSWGELAKKLERPQDKNGYLEYVTVFDYTDYESRCVWAVCSNSDSVTATPEHSAQGIKVLEEENKLGFIPYAIRRWGNSLSLDTNRRVTPLLQSVYDSGDWERLNVIKSIDASLTIKRAAQMQFAAETPPGQDIEMDYTEPAGVAYLPPGTRQFTPIPAQSFDQRLQMQKNETSASIWQTTVAKILQSLEFSSGTPSSSVNQLLSQAANSLSPYKILGEKALEEVAHLMLCWVKYYSKEYEEVDFYGRYDDKERMGKEVRISGKTIDPDVLQIEVILTADKPVDMLQQVNAAILTKQNFPVPDDELMEHLGYGDPVALAKRRKLQDMMDAYVNAELQRIAQRPQLEAQMETMQMQMGMQQQAQSQQMEQEMAAREQEAAMAQAADGGAPAQEQAGGLGFNPNAGGIAPQPNMGV
jgi:hypothetical protein